MINQFEGKYEVLSNFSTSTPIFVIIQPGMVSHVSALEYGYQAYKSLDPGVRMLITGASTPGKAKRIGQTVLLRPNWEQIKERVMKDLLIQKFTLNPKALEVLLGTGGRVRTVRLNVFTTSGFTELPSEPDLHLSAYPALQFSS